MVSKGEVKEVISFDYPFVVGEGIETRFPMIRTHTALTDSAKAHMGCGYVHNGIVYTSTTK